MFNAIRSEAAAVICYYCWSLHCNLLMCGWYYCGYSRVLFLLLCIWLRHFIDLSLLLSMENLDYAILEVEIVNHFEVDVSWSTVKLQTFISRAISTLFLPLVFGEVASSDRMFLPLVFGEVTSSDRMFLLLVFGEVASSEFRSSDRMYVSTCGFR